MSAMKRGGKRRKMGPWPRLQKFWDIRAACNFIGGGTGSGLLFIAAVLVFLDKFNPLIIITGFSLISFGFLMVFWEIGKPWRSINMFFHPQTSWMTREGIMVIPLLLSAGFLVLNSSELMMSIIAGFMGLFALIFLYCQVRILHAARGIPSWCHPALKPFIFSTGLAEATGIAVCLPGLSNEKGLWGVLLILLLSRLIFWNSYTKSLNNEGAPEASCNVLDSIHLKVLLSHIAAIALILAAGFTNTSILTIIAGFIATTTGWYIKVVIVTRAAQTRGFAIPRTPIRGKGKSRLLGIRR
ncbi:MAG: phenylacetyl-CoA:acceptor oxidoreductase [Gammaproteobacteria bacterium]|nr:phenylacetyl-CoA:acceptor oxidoreductase [Gammaproteobacteria bacterium]